MGLFGRNVLLVLLALAVLVGCSEPAATAPDVGPLEPFTPTTTFTILTPGTDARPIRLSRRDGQREQARIINTFLQQDTVAGVRRAEVEIPTVTMDYTTTATTMPGDHFLVLERADDLELGTAPGLSPEVLSRLNENMRARIGSVIVREETSTGQTVAQGHRFPETMDPASADEQEQRMRAERAGAIPFPPDPLGEGAQWQATQATTYAGVTSNASFGATLLHRDRNHVTVQWTLEIHATVDPSAAPEAPPWRTFQLHTMDVTTRGTKTLDLDALAPDEETVDTTTVVSYDLRGEPVSSTRKVHSVKVRLIPRAVLFALGAVGFALLALARWLPRWLRGESSMPYAVSRVAGALFVALGIGGLTVAFAGTKGVRPFTTSVEILIPVALVAAAWAMLVLYWWRWRAGAEHPDGTPPYR